MVPQKLFGVISGVTITLINSLEVIGEKFGESLGGRQALPSF